MKTAPIRHHVAFVAVLQREIRLAIRRQSEVLAVVFFFVMVAALFPLGIGPDLNTLRQIAPGVLWVGALLSTLLALPRMFEADYRDGTLEQMALSATPLGWLVLAKMVAHWLLCGLPLVLLAPLLGLQFDLPADALATLCLTLLLGTPVLSLIGGIGAALTLGLRGAGVLLSLLVLPLFIPVLIFGAGAVQAQASGLGIEAHVSILCAMLLPALFFSPMACAVALRIALE